MNDKISTNHYNKRTIYNEKKIELSRLFIQTKSIMFVSIHCPIIIIIAIIYYTRLN